MQCSVSLAPLKNALDWGSRPSNVWAGKAAAAVSAVGGGGDEHNFFSAKSTANAKPLLTWLI